MIDFYGFLSHQRQIYDRVQTQKQRLYNEGIINVEHGSFCPLVYSVTGGSGPEARFFLDKTQQIRCCKYDGYIFFDYLKKLLYKNLKNSISFMKEQTIILSF